MTVWCVTEYTWGGGYLISIWSTKALAEQEMQRLITVGWERLGIEEMEVDTP